MNGGNLANAVLGGARCLPRSVPKQVLRMRAADLELKRKRILGVRDGTLELRAQV